MFPRPKWPLRIFCNIPGSFQTGFESNSYYFKWILVKIHEHALKSIFQNKIPHFCPLWGSHWYWWATSGPMIPASLSTSSLCISACRLEADCWGPQAATISALATGYMHDSQGGKHISVHHPKQLVLVFLVSRCSLRRLMREFHSIQHLMTRRQDLYARQADRKRFSWSDVPLRDCLP